MYIHEIILRFSFQSVFSYFGVGKIDNSSLIILKGVFGLF
jgi:hypothetical protein